jgi:hypothetical protein
MLEPVVHDKVRWTVPIGDCGVSMPIAAGRGGVEQRFDLGRRQVLSGSRIYLRWGE